MVVLGQMSLSYLTSNVRNRCLSIPSTGIPKGNRVLNDRLLSLSENAYYQKYMQLVKIYRNQQTFQTNRKENFSWESEKMNGQISQEM